jgi:hypothetical protein
MGVPGHAENREGASDLWDFFERCLDADRRVSIAPFVGGWRSNGKRRRETPAEHDWEPITRFVAYFRECQHLWGRYFAGQPTLWRRYFAGQPTLLQTQKLLDQLPAAVDAAARAIDDAASAGESAAGRRKAPRLMQ